MPRVFISHSSRDNAEARRLTDWLRTSGFDEVFLDIDKHAGIPPGVEWERKLYAEVSRSTAVVLLLTKNWHESKWCFVEFAQARALGKDIIPVLATADGEQFIGDNLQQISLIQNRDEALERLLNRLHEIGRLGPDGFSLPPGRPPFPGLLSFDRDDAAIYFGRSDLVRDNLNTLDTLRNRGGERVLLLHGESGSGKSSLLKAGLLPQLDRRKSDWLCLPVFRPGQNPAPELRASLLTALGSDQRKVIDQLLSEPTIDHARSVVDALHDKVGNHQATVLLAIDQIEELLTLHTAPNRARFIRILQALLEPSLKTLAIATVRTAELSSLHDVIPLAMQDQLIGPFPLDRLPEIIRKPAQVVGLAVDDRLVAAIVRDAGTSDMLPLVAFLLRQLYDRHGSDHRLTLEEYQSLGDTRAGLSPLEACVRTAADRAIDRIKPTDEELKALRETFVPGLVRVDDRGCFARQPLAANRIPPQANRLIEALVEDRLLVRRDNTIDVAHESLFNVWPFLRDLLADELEFLQSLARLSACVADWRSSQPASREQTLLTGLQLSRCETWLSQHPVRFDDEQRAFITESMAARDQAIARRRRLQRIVLMGSTAAVIIFALLGGFALVQRNAAITKGIEAQRQGSLVAAKNVELQAQIYDNAIAVAEREITQNHDVGKAGKLLDTQWATTARGWEWRYLDRLRDGSHKPLIGHVTGLWGSEFCPDGNTIVTCSIDGTIKIWDLHSSKLIRSIDADYVPGISELLRLRGGSRLPIMCISVSPDGSKVASGSFLPKIDLSAPGGISRNSPGLVRVWDLKTGAMLHEYQDLSGVVLSTCFSADGKHLAASSINAKNEFAVWDLETHQLVAIRQGHKSQVHRLRYSSCGRYLASGDTDGVLTLWDTRSLTEICTIQAHGGALVGIDFEPLGSKHFATAGQDGLVHIWDTASKTRVFDLLGHTGAALDVRYTPDGKRLVTCGFDKTVRVWDPATGREKITLRGHTELVWNVSVSPSGDAIVSSSFDNTARIWNSAKRDLELRPGEFLVRGHRERVNAVAMSQNGRVLASGSWDKDVRLWNAKDGTPVGVPFNDHGAVVWGVALNKDGSLVASASWDHTVVIRNRDKPERKAVLRGHTAPVHSVAFSPDGDRVASAGFDAQLLIWNAENGELITRCEGFLFPVMALTYSNDGAFLISGGSDKDVKVRDANTGSVLLSLPGHSASVHSVAMSPNQELVASGSWDHTVRIWRVENRDGQLKATLRFVLTGHQDRVNSVAFSPDPNGRYLVTGSEDKTVRIWDTDTGLEVRDPFIHRGVVWSVAFDDTGDRIITGSWDESAWIRALRWR